MPRYEPTFDETVISHYENLPVSTESTALAGTTSVAERARRSWRAIFFAPIGDGRRRRRGSDGVRLIVALLVVISAVLVLRSNTHPEDLVTHALSPPPLGVRWLVDVFWIGGSIGTIALLLALSALARRWTVLRDLAASAAGTLAVSGLLIVVLGASGGRPESLEFEGYTLSFPVIHVALALSVATAGLPYLSRTVQRLIEAVVFLAVLATVVAGHGLPANVIGSMGIGWGVTAAMHLGWGSPLGLPSQDELSSALSTIGIDAVSVTPTRYQSWGVAHYLVTTKTEDRLLASFYGRDAAGAAFLGKLYRFVAYRNSGPTLSLTRIQQVEHESSVTQLAARSGARVPEVLSASEFGPSHDAALIARLPAGVPLFDLEADGLSDDTLDDLFAQMLRLRSGRIAHGAIGPHTVLADSGADAITLVDFSKGVSNGDVFLLDQDMAGAMATAALVVGPDRAARAAGRTVPPDVLNGTLSHLRRAGLDPSINIGLRGKKSVLDDLRSRTAQRSGIEKPELVEPRRLSWNQVLVAVGSLVGGWALILVLINASHSLNTIRNAQWGWVIATAVLCWSGYLGGAVSNIGTVPGSLPLGRVMGLELANSFTTLAGGNPAVLATQVRFYQQQGYDTTTAVTSGALLSVSSLLVKLVLFLIALPFAWSSFHFGRSLHQGNHAGVLWTLLVVVTVLGVTLLAVFSVPRWRRHVEEKLRPRVSTIRENFRALASHPIKILQLFGGQIAAQLLVVLGLGAALHAFGTQLSLAALVIAATMAGVLASASPAGGGMGVAEAGLIIALTAAGISKNQATAAVFVQRSFTAYLPPIFGWFTLMWMRRKDYL
jgi:undecaprenyl-diphosphatase